jgi:HTH-type transcriptional regulator/antitoxin HigA
MPVTTAPRRAKKDSYLELVKKFPLKTLKNDTEHDRALEMIDSLMGYDLDRGSGDYLDALIVLVTKYEDDHDPIEDDLTPKQALRALIEMNNLTQADIGRLIGSEPAVSMFLKGTRSLSKKQARVLSDHFKVDLSLFL